MTDQNHDVFPAVEVYQEKKTSSYECNQFFFHSMYVNTRSKCLTFIKVESIKRRRGAKPKREQKIRARICHFEWCDKNRATYDIFVWKSCISICVCFLILYVIVCVCFFFVFADQFRLLNICLFSMRYDDCGCYSSSRCESRVCLKCVYRNSFIENIRTVLI